MGISGNMQSLSQLCACYGVPRVTRGFTTLFIGETFAVWALLRLRDLIIFVWFMPCDKKTLKKSAFMFVYFLEWNEPGIVNSLITKQRGAKFDFNSCLLLVSIYISKERETAREKKDLTKCLLQIRTVKSVRYSLIRDPFLRCICLLFTRK